MAGRTGWAAACDACDKDERCKGWRTDNNRTATLLTGFVRGDGLLQKVRQFGVAV